MSSRRRFQDPNDSDDTLTRTDSPQTKEDFCPACVAVPMAMAGIGAGVYGSHGSGSYRNRQQIAFWVGIAFLIISIIVALYYAFVKECKQCK